MFQPNDTPSKYSTQNVTVWTLLNSGTLGTRSFQLEDTDDDEIHHLPPNASTAETQALLTTEDAVPRYLTASPRKFHGLEIFPTTLTNT